MISVVLFACALILSVATPPLLERVMLALPPRAAEFAWLACIGTTLVFGLSATVVLVWPDHPPAEDLLESTLACLSVAMHAIPHWFADPVGALAMLAACVAAGRVVIVARRYVRAGARVRAFHRDVVAVVARTTEGPHHPVMWLEHPMPLAYSVAGRPGFVVVTNGLTRGLTETECGAVLAHEHAHLRAGHHRMIRSCEVLASALPRIPLFAAAPRAMATLVELDADECAASATSRSAMHAALRSVSHATSTAPAPLLSFGGDVIALRLRRLSDNSDRRPTRPKPSYVAVACLPVAASAAIAIAAVSLLGAAACLLPTFTG